MKKKTLCRVLYAGSILLLLTGCGRSEKKAETETETEAVTEQVTEEVLLRGVALPDPSEYLIADAGNYIDLGSTDGLELVRSVYFVTDEDIDMEIDNLLYEQAELKPQKRAVEESDILNVDMTWSIGAEEHTEEDYQVELGYEDLGTVFDETAPGHKAGDTLTFSDTFDEYAMEDAWVGQTVQFTVKIKEVLAYDVPEVTDQWVSENTGYKTVDEYREAIRQNLKTTNEYQSLSELRQVAVDQVMEESVVHDLPEELVIQAQNAMADSFHEAAEMFGMTLEEAYEAFGYTEESMQEEALSQLNRRVLISALAQQENIVLKEEDLEQAAEELYREAGYDNVQDLIDEYGPIDLAMTAMEAKIGDLLISRAVVTEEYFDQTAEDLELEDTYESEEALPGLAGEGEP